MKGGPPLSHASVEVVEVLADQSGDGVVARHQRRDVCFASDGVGVDESGQLNLKPVELIDIPGLRLADATLKGAPQNRPEHLKGDPVTRSREGGAIDLLKLVQQALGRLDMCVYRLRREVAQAMVKAPITQARRPRRVGDHEVFPPGVSEIHQRLGGARVTGRMGRVAWPRRCRACAPKQHHQPTRYPRSTHGTPPAAHPATPWQRRRPVILTRRAIVGVFEAAWSRWSPARAS